MRFQISALSNEFNDVHFRLINNLHSEDVYSFTSCINSLDAAFKWSGHTYRLWYDIMLIYGKMYSAHLCHFVIRFSAGNLIQQNYALDAQTKSTSAPLAITGLLCLTYYFSDVARLAFQQSSKFSSVVIWFSVECRVDSK